MTVEGAGPGAPDEAEGAFARGQRCLTEGDAAAAVQHLEAALLAPGGDTVDARLLLAEALWQQAGGKGTDLALPHYERAGELAEAAKDASKQAMVAIGHGFALTQLGRAGPAVEVLRRAKSIAERDGNAGAVHFVERLLGQAEAQLAAGAAAEAEDGEAAIRSTWRHFAEARAAGRPAVLFLRGSLSAPLDEPSQRGVSKLRAAGCVKLDVVDVCSAGADVPDGLQAISNSAHLELPQLFIAGAVCDGWLEAELTADMLRERLAAAGVELGEPHAEPCHGTGAFAEGLESWETALVQLVSQLGTDWPQLAAKLREQGHEAALLAAAGPGCPDAAAAVELVWERLAPVVKEKLEHQPEMPCGHSCNTCPTRHDCQLHDAVGDAPRDIEDLVMPHKR